MPKLLPWRSSIPETPSCVSAVRGELGPRRRRRIRRQPQGRCGSAAANTAAGSLRAAPDRLHRQRRRATNGAGNWLAVAEITTAAYQSACSGVWVTLPLADENHPLIAADEQVIDGLLD
jgi:hypothetical protein